VFKIEAGVIATKAMVLTRGQTVDRVIDDGAVRASIELTTPSLLFHPPVYRLAFGLVPSTHPSSASS
jgi:hypothetical protein